MKRYLLALYVPADGEPPPPEALEEMRNELDALNADLKAAGAWVFAGALHPPDTATVVRPRDDGAFMTDGPFIEGKEFLGGFDIIAAPDLDAALGWARRLAEITTLPVEVRPLQDPAA
ncbi:YciI family protein [Actinocorallia aurantiaca]|uniref:YciI family protein n=1 Tax=Actinocorallia aurantiaca TaxID=46204 RepID=A0ABN3UBF4_9ACTN